MSKTTDEIENLLKENDVIFEEQGATCGFDNYSTTLVKRLVEEVKRYENELDLDYIDDNFIEIKSIERLIDNLKEKRDKTENGMMFNHYNNFIYAYTELIREYKKANDK